MKKQELNKPQEITPVEIHTGGDIVPPEIAISREPEKVLEEARRAAQALKRVVESKPKKVMIRGEQYLEFEDWQTLGKFYGLSAKVESTKYVEYGKAHGWEASAVVIHVPSGRIISRAEALCLNDEPNWKDKPLFMLRSMAQTRACAKALRNVLSWVVVLAGYKPTPAEEIQELPDVKIEEPATEKQIELIKKLMSSHVFTDDEREIAFKKLDTLTKDKASEWIERIKQTIEERKAVEKEKQEKDNESEKDTLL